jgi:cytidylate kinase
VKIWLGAVKKDLCMLTAPCQIRKERLKEREGIK